MSFSIRDKQIGKAPKIESTLHDLAEFSNRVFFNFLCILKEILKYMLNFNQPLPSSSTSNLSEPSWKVLVYDELGQDIISPLLTVKELRDLGVTAHL